MWLIEIHIYPRDDGKGTSIRARVRKANLGNIAEGDFSIH